MKKFLLIAALCFVIAFPATILSLVAIAGIVGIQSHSSEITFLGPPPYALLPPTPTMPPTSTRSVELGSDVQVELIVRAVDPSGATFAFVNNTDQIFTRGQNFTLEQKIDGVWRPVPLIREDVAWALSAISIEAMEIRETDINWEWLHGELSSGQYRVTKFIHHQMGHVAANMNNLRIATHSLSTEFEIQTWSFSPQTSN